jgi:hypothetical protein
VYRVPALVVVLVALLAAPASAALAPGALVLREGDLPAGFHLVEDQSGVRSNSRRLRDSPPDQRKLLTGWGRITGYQALYSRRHPSAQVISLVDGFRHRQDLVMLVERLERARKPGDPKATPTSIDDEGWFSRTSFSRGSTRAQLTTVIWRQGRVLGTVVGVDVAHRTVLGLARTQEQRIARVLR